MYTPYTHHLKATLPSVFHMNQFYGVAVFTSAITQNLSDLGEAWASDFWMADALLAYLLDR